MNNKKYIYRRKLTFKDYGALVVFGVAIYVAITDKTVNRNLFILFGMIFLILFIYVYLKSKKLNEIIIDNRGIVFIKSSSKKESIIEYSKIEKLNYEDDKDDGSSIEIDTGKLFNKKFFANKFESKAEYASFCEEIEIRLKNR